MRGVAMAVLVVTTVACASTSTSLSPDAYRLEIRDNPAARRFDVVLYSHHGRALCVGRDSWPTSTGTLFVENADVYLQISAGPRPIKSPFVSVYCPGGCGEQTIKPGEALTGFFAYSAFGDADEIAADASRRLHYALAPHACRRLHR